MRHRPTLLAALVAAGALALPAGATGGDDDGKAKKRRGAFGEGHQFVAGVATPRGELVEVAADRPLGDRGVAIGRDAEPANCLEDLVRGL
jgi:hypothetical protein